MYSLVKNESKRQCVVWLQRERVRASATKSLFATLKGLLPSETGEMLLEASLVQEHTASLHSGGAAALGESTSCSDARVGSLELYHNVLCVEHLLQAAEDLLVQALLDLRASREVLHDTVELGETDDLAVGEIAYVCDSAEQEEMMLAHRSEWDVLLEDHRVRSHRESGARGEVLGLQASTKLLHVHLGHTVRSLLD